MAFLTEIEQYDEGVYRLETADPVLGGENGPANKSAKALANRTKWLKKAVDLILETLLTFKSAATKEASNTFGTGKVPLWDGLYTKDEIDNKVASMPVNNHQQAIGTSLITGSGALANMADMAISFSPKGKKILIMFSSPIHSDVTAQGLTCYINVDGANIMSQQATIYQQDLIFSMQSILTVVPGVEITVRAKWDANANIKQHGEVSPRVLTIIDLP